MTRRLLFSALWLLAGLFAATTASLATAATPAPLPSDSVYQLSAVLIDQHGKARDWRLRRGRPQLVAMFYTSCPYICPLIVDSGKGVENALTPKQRARLDILLVSIDPARDTPAALAQLAARRKLDPARWTLASPQASQVRTLAGVLGIRYRELADGEFNHTSELILLDADGRIVARTAKMGAVPDPEFLAAVRKVLEPAR
jgi:protein SCO1/2